MAQVKYAPKGPPSGGLFGEGVQTVGVTPTNPGNPKGKNIAPKGDHSGQGKGPEDQGGQRKKDCTERRPFGAGEERTQKSTQKIAPKGDLSGREGGSNNG